MHIVAVALALVAAGIHVYIWALESLWFMRPSVHGRFGLKSEEQAAMVRSFAYNQGFYNLFLTAGVGTGLLLVAAGDEAGGRAVVLFACGSMVAAGIVLVTHSRAFARAAGIQIVPALLAILAILFLR
jgi:putative membrane protein